MRKICRGQRVRLKLTKLIFSYNSSFDIIFLIIVSSNSSFERRVAPKSFGRFDEQITIAAPRAGLGRFSCIGKYSRPVWASTRRVIGPNSTRIPCLLVVYTWHRICTGICTWHAIRARSFATPRGCYAFNCSERDRSAAREIARHRRVPASNTMDFFPFFSLLLLRGDRDGD